MLIRGELRSELRVIQLDRFSGAKRCAEHAAIYREEHSTPDNLATVREAYDSFARGDVPTVLGAFDPDIAWSEMAGTPYGGEFQGIDTVVQNVLMRFATE
jgi:hypothetical protein